MNRAKKAGEKVTVDVPDVYNCLEKIPLASDEAIYKIIWKILFRLDEA